MERSNTQARGSVSSCSPASAAPSTQQQKDDGEWAPPTTTSADLPEIKAPDDIDKISITNGDKGEVVLEKKGDKWELTKPVERARQPGEREAASSTT